MLHSADSGCCKNACFALSCIASLAQGHQHLLNHEKINSIVDILCSLLAASDEESIWFASMYVKKGLHWLCFTDHISDINLLLLLVSQSVYCWKICWATNKGEKKKTNQSKRKIGKLIQVEFKLIQVDMDNLMKNKVMCSRWKQIDLKNKLTHNRCIM